MEKGYVKIVRGLFWDTKVRKGILGTASGKTIIPLSWGVQNLEGNRCMKCRLILFKYFMYGGEKSSYHTDLTISLVQN